jgi:uncharacterized delta-60 repeat protein
MKSYKIIVFLLPVLAILVLTTSLRAQIDGVDNNYFPLITGASPGRPFFESLQPDGKLIVSGDFYIVDGIPRVSMVRLNTDGSVDPSFDCVPCRSDGFFSTAVVQADGKILLAGGTPTPQRPKMVRLNPDGSQDFSFADVFTIAHGHFGTVEALQADGKAYVVTHKVGMTVVDRTLYRLNTDGTIDTGFTPFLVRDGNNNEYFGGFKILPDGRMFIYGKTSYGPLAQINEDGSKNTAFESPVLTFPSGPGPFPQQPNINSFEMQSDNKPVFTGVFETVNGIPKSRVARLNPDGSLDTGYDPQPPFTVYGNDIVKVYPGDKTLYHRTDTAKKFIRNNPDGSVDNTFSAPDELTSASRWLVLPGDQLLVDGEYNGVQRYIRLNADGSRDTGFGSPAFEREATVTKIAVAPDDRVAIYGGPGFGKVDGFAKPGFAVLNGDGTVDTKFDPGDGFTGGNVSCLAMQDDGNVLAGGSFTGYNHSAQGKLIRLNADGSFDSKLGPSISSTVLAIAVWKDSKILIGGMFDSVESTPKTQIALINSNGSVDSAFNPVLGGTGREVRSLFLQGDGKVMVGGVFSSMNGSSRSNLARLNSNGTLDTAFNAGSISSISYVSQLADGNYMVLSGGVLKRLASNGSVDSTFTSPTVSGITAVQPATDGTVIIGGDFTAVNGIPKKYLARLKSNGSLDVLFNPNGTNARVWALSAQTDGNVIVGGEFTKIGNVGRFSVARILASAVARVTPFDFDGDGRADISITRPGDFNWYQMTGINYNFRAIQFGEPGDKVTPADYDGDGKTDIGVFRPATGDWSYRSTIDGLQHGFHWGQNGDVPLAADYNGDGKADLAAVRNFGWWIANASNGQTIMFINFGQAGDKPMVGDFDGDGKADPAVYRPSEGNWYYAASGSGNATLAIHWGISEDIPVPADYDGDGKTDAAVFRPSEGNWYQLNSSDGTWIGLHFGLTGDKPIAADYDGDGKADIAVYRPSDHYWYILGTTAGFYGFPFGLDTDIPSPNAFIQP